MKNPQLVPVSVPVPVLVLVLPLAACGTPATPAKPVIHDPSPIAASPPPPPDAAPPKPKRTILTIVSGSIDAERSTSIAWDDVAKKPAGKTAPQTGPLAQYLLQHPELANTLTPLDGEAPITRRAAETAGADPMVLLEINHRVYRTTARPNELEPVWNFPVVVDLMDTDLVHVTVVDWDEPSAYDVIGHAMVTGRELLAGAIIEMPRAGRFGKLVLSVAPAPVAAEPTRHRAAVAGKATWSETGISLIAGQRVSIIAAGEICTRGSERSSCAGPEGQARPAESNVAGFERVGHGQLIAGVGDVRFAIGREIKLVAPSSGPLLLGINDRNVGDNSGELEVAIVVD
jgi:hypothetical protein